MIAIHDDPAVLRVDEHGAIRVGDTRVTLDTVVQQWVMGATAEQIADSFPSLRGADIYSAIGYYLRHRHEVDQYLAEGEQIAQEWLARSTADPRHRAFRAWLDSAVAERNVEVRS